ncbi:MAG TPA: AI-2E family transporter, partial [Chitinophagaceae bacterium]|nr:AI-2E family transporter [Chitinophagaceae bacterium]
MENTKSYPFYFKLASVVIAIIGLVYIAIWAKMVIVPLIIGLLLAIILTPIARFFENKLKFPRSVSAITSTVLLTLFVLSIMFLLGTQMSHMTEDLPAFKEQIISALEKLQDWISEKYDITNEEQLKYLTDNASQSIGIGTTVIEGTISSLSSIGMLLIFTFLYTLFILMYRKHIISFLLLCFKDPM